MHTALYAVWQQTVTEKHEKLSQNVRESVVQ